MSNDIIKKFQKAQLLLNNNAYAEIKGNSDYDYLINELIEYIEENENDHYTNYKKLSRTRKKKNT